MNQFNFRENLQVMQFSSLEKNSSEIIIKITHVLKYS